MIQSYSLEEVAAQHLPTEWKEPVRWLKTRISRGEIKAKRISRGVYRMTDAQIEAWLAADPAPRAQPDVVAEPTEEAGAVTPIIGGLSPRCRRRATGQVSA